MINQSSQSPRYDVFMPAGHYPRAALTWASGAAVKDFCERHGYKVAAIHKINDIAHEVELVEASA